jgi:hypothetical protein
VASYVLPPNAVEGDCGGIAAVRRLPIDGVLLLVIDYGAVGVGPFPSRPRRFTLGRGRLSDYECFGRSYLFRFSVGERNFQAHVALGADAPQTAADDALAILDSLLASPG